jgi:hypothetical protein
VLTLPNEKGEQKIKEATEEDGGHIDYESMGIRAPKGKPIIDENGHISLLEDEIEYAGVSAVLNMIYIVYTYLMINTLMVGSYILDIFNDDTKIKKFFICFILFFFGGILFIYELTIADKFAEWWDSSELCFLWRLHVLKTYDNMEENYLKVLENQISAEKNKNSIFYKHLKLILKRNNR